MRLLLGMRQGLGRAGKPPLSGLVLAAAAALGACASAGRPDGTALLLVTESYELHLRSGELFVVSEGTARRITDYAELHTLYRRNGEPLVLQAPASETTSVLGWRDLACVRAGQACGREPDSPARDMVRLRLRF